MFLLHSRSSSRLASTIGLVAGVAGVLLACGDDATIPNNATLDASTPTAEAGAGDVEVLGPGIDAGKDSGKDSGTDSGTDSGNDAGDGAVPNEAPVAQAQTLTTVADLPLSVALHATDPESASLTYAIVANPAHGTLSGLDAATGLVTYTPSAGYVGADSFTFKANDGALDSTSATITIDVTAIPQPIAQAQAVSTPEDTAKTITLSSTGGTGTVTYAIKTPPTHGTLGVVAGAVVTYTPGANYAGSDSFVFTATSDGVTFSEATINLTVTPVNDAPVATPQSGATGYAGAPVVFTLVATDVETAAAQLTFATANATNGTLGPIVGNTVTFTPTAAGAASFSFTANDGDATSDPVTVSMTATPAPNCQALLRAGQATSGVYPIDPDGANAAYSTLDMYCDMVTDGGGWTRILNHDRIAGGFFASKTDAALRNAADPLNAIYSVIQNIEGFRANGGFEFRLNWPLVPNVRNVWVQTSNPTVAGPVTGYRAVSVDGNSARWGGLELSTAGETLLDGSVKHGNWWYAVGQVSNFGANGFPGAEFELGGDGSTSHVQLWVRPPAVCGNGFLEGGETCDDTNTTGGDGCSSTCAVERTSRSSCLAVLTAGESVGDGAYVIDPDGAGALAPITTYCDMTRDGGGWTLVGKVGQGDFTNLTDAQYLDLVANPTNDVNPAAFANGNHAAYSSMAFFNKANTNALWTAAEGKVVRVDMTANYGDNRAPNGTYFQKKINPPAGWDFWSGLRDARRWNDDASVSGENVNGFGTQFVLTNIAANYNSATHAVTHSGDGTFGWWDAYTHTLNDGSTLSMSRHGGLLGDGIGPGWAWLFTLKASGDGRWKNDTDSASKSRIWLR